MAFVVTESCIKCKYTDCVEVCPVDCFYEGPDFLVIHPDECIDCALCEPECPIDAILSEDELPDDQIDFIEINARLSEVYENITEAKDPLPEADKYENVKNKRELIGIKIHQFGKIRTPLIKIKAAKKIIIFNLYWDSKKLMSLGIINSETIEPIAKGIKTSN